jgi:hypothetical protein
MGAVPLDEVLCGMVLESDVVVAAEARLLLARGVALTDAHLTLLRMWGIAEVEVCGVSRRDVLDRAGAGLDEDRRRALEAEVADLFRHAGRDNPVVEELRYQALRRRLRQEARADGPAR